MDPRDRTNDGSSGTLQADMEMEPDRGAALEMGGVINKDVKFRSGQLSLGLTPE